MSRELKVYGWTGWAHKQMPGKQTRSIMAAHSAAEVMRATGMSRADWNHSGVETGNPV